MQVNVAMVESRCVEKSGILASTHARPCDLFPVKEKSALLAPSDVDGGWPVWPIASIANCCRTVVPIHTLHGTPVREALLWDLGNGTLQVTIGATVIHVSGIDQSTHVWVRSGTEDEQS